MRYKQICSACGREWYGFEPSWRCDDCMERLSRALKKYKSNAKTIKVKKYVYNEGADNEQREAD